MADENNDGVFMARQGDVLLVQVDLTVKKAKMTHVPRKKGQGIILAAGEATGHHHRVRQSHAREYRHDGNRYLFVSSKGATLTHEEHDDVPLPGGVFQIVQQREYEPVIREEKVVQRTTRQVYD